MEINDQFTAPVALLQGNKPPILIGYEAGWAPEPVWTLWTRGKSLSLQGIEIRPPSS
jgi:hypothetical protein